MAAVCRTAGRAPLHLLTLSSRHNHPGVAVVNRRLHTRVCLARASFFCSGCNPLPILRVLCCYLLAQALPTFKRQPVGASSSFSSFSASISSLLCWPRHHVAPFEALHNRADSSAGLGPNTDTGAEEETAKEPSLHEVAWMGYTDAVNATSFGRAVSFPLPPLLLLVAPLLRLPLRGRLHFPGVYRDLPQH